MSLVGLRVSKTDTSDSTVFAYAILVIYYVDINIPKIQKDYLVWPPPDWLFFL